MNGRLLECLYMQTSPSFRKSDSFGHLVRQRPAVLANGILKLGKKTEIQFVFTLLALPEPEL